MSDTGRQHRASRQDEPLWTHQIFVCTNLRDADNPRTSCGRHCPIDVVAAFKDALKRHGLAKTVRANKSGCLEACESGPAVVIYPEAVWYRIATPADAERVVAEHLAAGRVVDELLLDLAPLPYYRARQDAKP